MERNSFMSKKVLFLYPHSVIQQEMVRELVANEYAVYLVNDHEKLRSVIGTFDQPILFINIDDHLEPDAWKTYIKEIMDSDDNSAQIGILTYNEDTDLAQEYLMELMVPCGFIKLKLGLEQSKKIILKTLEANEAKGRRKYLRIDCWDLKNTELNVKIGEKLCSGRIKDISSVGMAFVLNEEQALAVHSVLSDIQLKLKGKIARVSGPIMGQRVEAGGTVYVLLFDKTVSPDTRSRIHAFMYDTLQEEINKIINS